MRCRRVNARHMLLMVHLSVLISALFAPRTQQVHNYFSYCVS